MKKLKIFIAVITLFLTFISLQPVAAQCAMCAANVESSHNAGGKKADGLNNGILVLLAAPYLAAAAVGYIWFKRFKRKNIEINMRKEKFNLN